MWLPLESTYVTTKVKLLCRCQCGGEHRVRVREIIAGKSRCCRSCSCRLKAAAIPEERRVLMAKRASLAAGVALSSRVDPYRVKYGAQLDMALGKAAAAKQRCTNPNCLGFSNYGGRGIKFAFPTIRAFAEWVLDNLGARPTVVHSLDRIDNNRHYEPGNLRWATYTEQDRNKRKYKRTRNGERIRGLKAVRQDLTYETIRLWIIQGASDEEIINRRKYDRPSV